MHRPLGPPPRRARGIAGALGAVILASVPVSIPAAASDATPDRGRLPMDALGAWFAERPDLRGVSGTGSKPYERLVWLARTRSVPPGRSAGRLRAEAWDAGRARAGESRRSAAAWFSIGPVAYSGRATAIDFDPTDPATVYVGTAGGGLWKSTDGGDTWSPLTDDQPSLGVGAVKVLPWNPDVVLLGTGEGQGVQFAGWTMDVFGVGMLRSTDAGATWNATSLGYPISGFHGFNAIAAEPATQTLLAAAVDGLWRSTDDGATWTQVDSPGNFFDVKWKPGDPSRVYAARGRDFWVNSGTTAGNGVRVSTDGGLTFAPSGTGQPASSLIGKSKLAVTPADPSVVYAKFVDIANGSVGLGLYRSTDDGSTWSPRSTQNIVSGQGWFNLSLVADPDDADRLLAGGVFLYGSTDGGQTLVSVDPMQGFGTQTSPHADNHAAVYEPGSTSNVWVANDGGVWRSTNDGATWASRREGIISYQLYDVCVAQASPTRALAAAQDNGTSVGDSTSWAAPSLTGDGGPCAVTPDKDNVVYGQIHTGMHFKSVTGGQSWTANGTGINVPGPFVTPKAQDQQAGNHRHLYTAANDGIYRTTNGGTLWTRVAPHFARWIDISQVDGNIVWTISNASGVWHTQNDGNNWTQSTAFPANGLETKIHAHPDEAGSALATFGGYATAAPHVLLTTNFGATWSDATGDLPDIPVNTILVDPDRVDEWYVGTDSGVWKSEDRGTTWALFGAALPNVVVTDLELRRATRKLVAATYGRGVWEIDLALSQTGAGVVAAAAPPGLMLDPPSPNPVRNAAALRFASRAPGPARLDIYDVSGRRVTVVAEGVRGDGVIRNAAWITADVPSGVYFAVLEAGEARLSRKIVVAK